MNVGDENDNTTAYAGYANIPLSFIKYQRDSMVNFIFILAKLI